MKVLVVHTDPPVSGRPGRLRDEFDLGEAAHAVVSALPGSVARGIAGWDEELRAVIAEHRPDVVFNLCEAPLGRPDLEAHAAAQLEALGVRFTGARGPTLELCRVKDRVNAVLSAAGIPVPGMGIFPCVVKPAEEDGSAWIWRDSLCRNPRELNIALCRMPSRALVEEFIPGREFAVSIWGGDEPACFSIGETLFGNGLQLITYDAKWLPESSDYHDSPVSYATEIANDLRMALASNASRVWSAVGARGYLRVDQRLDASGLPRVLDVNPNPALGSSGGIRSAAAAAGGGWDRFVRSQVEWAC
jgi:D-alanine-D-alanine ligase